MIVFTIYRFGKRHFSGRRKCSRYRFRQEGLDKVQKQPQRKRSSASSVAGKTPARRKRRSPEEIRSRLLQAAQAEFKRSGFVGATTAAIAREADVTEAQLFRYFDSKAALFREAVFEPLDAHFSDFSARNLATLDKARGHRDTVAAYIHELEQFLDEHAKLLLSLAMAQLFATGSLEGVGEIDSLTAYFERGAATMSRRIEGEAPVDPRLMVRVSFAAVMGCVLFKDWIFPPGLASEGDISAAIVDFVLDGIHVNSGPDRDGPK